MEERPATLGIQIIVGADFDAEEVAEATSQLRRVARGWSLRRLAGSSSLLPRSPLLNSVLAAIGSWLGGSQQRSIKLQIAGDVLELTGVLSKEQRRLTDEWLRRHGSQ